MTASATRKEKGLNIETIKYGKITWLNIENPTSSETEYLAQNYPFHPLDLDDCISRIQRPKIDQYETYLFMVLHFPVYNKEARVTTADAEQTTVAAFRPWRVLPVHIPWALANIRT